VGNGTRLANLHAGLTLTAWTAYQAALGFRKSLLLRKG
jgi:hypothetical protein